MAQQLKKIRARTMHEAQEEMRRKYVTRGVKAEDA